MPDPYTQLLEWRRAETTARALAKLPPDFYAIVRQYLAETRTTFEAELRSNPSSRKGELARQTYQRAYQLARDVVEARTRKLLDLAFQAALGGSRDVPGALAEDRALFDRILETLRSHRAGVAPYLEPLVLAPADVPAPAPAPPAGTARSGPPVPSPLPAPAAATRPDVPASGPALAYVRILRDARPIALGSETIELRKEDVLSVGEETAKLLVSAGVAERVGAGAARAPVT